MSDNGDGSSQSTSSNGIAAQAKSAIDQLRSTGKWIITSFAAVGTLLLAGVQLTSIGTVSGYRLALAIAGLIISITAVLVAVFSLVSLLEPHVSAPDSAIVDADDPNSDLGKFVGAHRQVILPAGITTATELRQKFDLLRSKEHRSAAEESSLDSMLTSYSNIVWWSSYLTAKKNFNRVRLFVGGAAITIAAGASLYAWAATGPTEASSSDNAAQSTPTAVIEPVPVAVTVRLNSTGEEELKSELSSNCMQSATTKGIMAVAISADSSETTVILIPSPACLLPTRITIPLSDGTATATMPLTPAHGIPTSHTQAEPTLNS